MPDNQREPLLQLLKAYTPLDAADHVQADTIATFVRSTPSCFLRMHLSGHITGSAWLVDNSETRVLLTHHKKLGKWLQLGGHADGNPDILAVARREAAEESGLSDIAVVTTAIFDLDVHPIPARANEPAHHHYDIRFALKATGSEKFVVSAESNTLAWVEIDRVHELTDEPALLRMAAKWRARPLS